MKITLYKGCFLNNSYTEVFNVFKKDGSNKSVLDSYLDSLGKFEFENDFIYSEGAGSFQVDISDEQGNIFEYNYLKVEETYDDAPAFKRYCFIDDIYKISTTVFTVVYSEDIWSSFADKMKIRDAVLSNKLRNPTGPHYLPMKYDGNNYPEYRRFAATNIDKGFVVCQLQYYKLNQAGEVGERHVEIVFLSDIDRFNANTNPRAAVTADYRAIDIINEIYQGQSNKSVTVTIDPNTDQSREESYQYQIDNIILVPFGFPRVLGSGHTVAKFNDKITFESISLSSPYASSGTFVNDTLGIQPAFAILLDTNYLENDYKMVSIGPILHQFEITPNGTEIDVEIYGVKTQYDFRILMRYQNKEIDITDDFKLELPFNVLSSEQNTQAKIQRELANTKSALQVVEGVVQVGTQIAGAIMTGGVSLLGGSTSQSSERTRYNYARSGNTNRMTSRNITTNKQSQQQASVGGLMGGVMDIANGVTELVYNNKAMYSNTQGTFVTSNALINTGCAFCWCTINPDNEEQVNSLLNRVGYSVTMYIKDNSIFNFTEAFDIMKFVYAMIYGDFPQSITYQLTEILRSGIRILNKPDVEL